MYPTGLTLVIANLSPGQLKFLQQLQCYPHAHQENKYAKKGMQGKLGFRFLHHKTRILPAEKLVAWKFSLPDQNYGQGIGDAIPPLPNTCWVRIRQQKEPSIQIRTCVHPDTWSPHQNQLLLIIRTSLLISLCSDQYKL